MTSAAARTAGRPPIFGFQFRSDSTAPEWFCRDVLMPFLGTRVALSLIGFFASNGNWVGMWSGWDGGWYLSIARNGYSQHATEQSNTAFAPTLPLFMHLIGLVAGADGDSTLLLIGGFVTVNAALLIALGYLVALTRLDFDAGIAQRAALYALVFPSTLFLSAVYPHALFLAGAIPAFYYARRRRWCLAGVFAAFAVLSRVQGLLIVLPLAWEYLAQRRFEKVKIEPDACGLLLPALAAVAYATRVLAVSGRHRVFHLAYMVIGGYLALRFMSEFAQGIWVA